MNHSIIEIGVARQSVNYRDAIEVRPHRGFRRPAPHIHDGR